MNPFAIVAVSVGLYLEKVLGVSVPPDLLDRAWVRRVLTLLPVALLSALVVDQGVGSASGPVLDARVAGLAAAVVALALRAPFLLVLVVAAATTAALRTLT